MHGPAARAPRRRRGPRPARPLRRGAVADRARRRARRGPRALPAPRAAPRRADRLRGRGELEGDRRELQRVPALPRRAPRAQQALALPQRREQVRRRRLVRRLDDAQRRRGDDGARGRQEPPPADRRAHRAGDPLRLLLPDLPEHARLAAPRLRDAAHPVAARARAAPRSSASGCSSRRRWRPRASTRRTPSSSGTRSTARTGRSAGSRSSACRATTRSPAATPAQEDDVHDFDRMVADRYLEALRTAEATR